MTIARVEAWPWNVPMRSPYASAQRVTTTARNVLVRVTLEDGTEGWGESAPAFYVTGETQESVLAAVQSHVPLLVGQAVKDALPSLLGLPPGALSALEIALSDAASRVEGIPLCLWLAARRTTVGFSLSTDLSLPILPPDEAAIRAADAARAGFRALKIKVGSGDLEEDEARVRAVAEAAPAVSLRLDGNQGFSSESAVAFMESLSDLYGRIEIFEQPTPAADGAAMHRVSRQIPVPVYADESAQSLWITAQHLAGKNCSGIVLKLAKTGLFLSGAMAHLALMGGAGVLVGCMMETRIGITAALHLALSFGTEYAPLLDLDGHMLVNDTDLVTGGLTQEGDILRIDPTVAGLGVSARVG